MNSSDPPGPAEAPPRRALVTVLGAGSLAFALACGCCGIVPGAAILFAPDLVGLGQKWFEKMNLTVLKSFDDRLARAASEAESARIRKDRDQWADAVSRVDFGPLRQSVRHPDFRVYGVADAVVNLLGNALLFAAGIGILGRRAWGRRIGIGAAVLLIAAHLGSSLLFRAVGGDVMRAFEEIGGVFESLPAGVAGSGGAPPDPGGAGFRTGTTAWDAVHEGVNLVVASIWPIVLLVGLFSRGVRTEFEEWAAFHARR